MWAQGQQARVQPPRMQARPATAAAAAGHLDGSVVGGGGAGGTIAARHEAQLVGQPAAGACRGARSGGALACWGPRHIGFQRMLHSATVAQTV